MNNLRVISWNILNDGKVPQHPTQSERLKDIANTIKSYQTKQPTIIFLFEVVDQKNFAIIARTVGFEHWDSAPYANNHIGYIANFKPTKNDVIEHKSGRLTKRHNSNRKSLIVHYEDCSVTATHPPFHPLFHMLARVRSMLTIIRSQSSRKRIIVGDLNAFIVMPSRLLLWLAGFRYVFASSTKKDKFPSPLYKGITVPRIFPKASIDAHYTKHVTSKHHYRENTDLSDHPILVSDFVV